MTKVIVQNSATCNKCGDDIFSTHRHDFVTCKCGATSVDGGMAYLKRCGDDYTDTSIMLEREAVEACVDAVKWGNETGRNELGVALAVIRALRKHDLIIED